MVSFLLSTNDLKKLRRSYLSRSEKSRKGENQSYIPITKRSLIATAFIVLLETMKSADREHRVFKLQFAVGEFDMVIYDEKENCCEIFEIKHSGKQVPAQYRHLLDQEKCDKTEQRFGPIRGRYILYRGEDAALGNGVQYRNVERYLNDLPELNIAPAQEAGIEQTGPVL